MKKYLSFILIGALLLAGAAISIFLPHDAFGASVAMGLPLVAQMSRGDLEAIAESVLTDSYEGDDYEGFDELDDEDLYDGFDDPFVSFMGSGKSFLDEKKSGVYLTFSIINNSGYSKVVCLNPAFYNTQGLTLTKNGSGYVTNATINNYSVAEIVAAGHSEIAVMIADGLVYGTAEAGITVAGTNGKILDMLHFFKGNPTRIPEITIQSQKYSTSAIDTSMYSKIMTMRKVSPFRKFGDELIDLNDFFDVKQYQSGKIVVDTARYGMQADDQTLIFLEIDNDIKITFKFAIGGIGNQANVLYQKAEKAHRNIQTGVAGKIPVPVLKQRKQVARKQLKALRNTFFRPKK
jgi:hypothetical protein